MRKANRDSAYRQHRLGYLMSHTFANNSEHTITPAEVDMEIVPRIPSHVVSGVLADAFLLNDTTVVEVCKE
jgi:hypothetical protein